MREREAPPEALFDNAYVVDPNSEVLNGEDAAGLRAPSCTLYGGSRGGPRYDLAQATCSTPPTCSARSSGRFLRSS